jgi:hypothetical protein
VRWERVIELTTIRVTEGSYYEVADCSNVGDVIEDEKYKKIVMDHCRVRGRSIEVLKVIVIRDEYGNITKIWTIELFYGPFGVMIFLDNP